MTARHSVIMICYNQDEYIETALNSVLCERVKPYEIIIGDDFSTDGTRNILTKYKEKYPDIVRLVFNQSNIGIFANLNNLTPMVTGDMIHFLSGDDWYKPCFLENVNNKLAEFNLNPKNSRFILLPDVVLHNLDGTEQLVKNDPKLLAKYSPAGLVIRDLVRWRQVGLSCALFDKWPLFPEDSEKIGPWSDRIQHVMLAQHIENQFIMNCAGAVYRVGVGIASKTKQEELELSYCNALKYLHVLLVNKELVINKIDADCLVFMTRCCDFKLKLRLIDFFWVIFYACKLLLTDAGEFFTVKEHLYGVLRKIISKTFIGTLVRHIKQIIRW